MDQIGSQHLSARPAFLIAARVTLTEAYEREHNPIDRPDPIEAIKFRLEQMGNDFRALIGVFGQRTRVMS